jgi:hypothetical protein
MARGGYRPGSGPQKGTKYKKRGDKTEKPKKGEIPSDILDGAKAENLLPLDYMLKVMNDETEAKERRDRMAIAAAPFCHPRIAEGKGKKQEKDDKAAAAAKGRFSAGKPPLALVK